MAKLEVPLVFTDRKYWEPQPQRELEKFKI